MPVKVSNRQEKHGNKPKVGQNSSDPLIAPSDEEKEHREGKRPIENEDKTEASNLSPKNTLQGVCKPKKKEALRVVFSDPDIQAYRDHMMEHAIICKYMGLWPTERALCQWIKQHWRPKGDVKLHLGAKGFFTVVFSNLEDKDRVLDGGRYFLSSAGLYMRPWKVNFVPEKETFTQVPVWIRLFSLPIDYWGLATLKRIGDRLDTFIKAAEATMQRKYTSCARICVEMDVSGALHEGLWLEFRDEDYFQAIDYEQIPFRCRKCHEHGHLVRECPLIKPVEDAKLEQPAKNQEVFKKPKSRQRAYRKRINKAVTYPSKTLNPFSILDSEADSKGNNKETKLPKAPQKNKTDHRSTDAEETPENTEIQTHEVADERDEDTDMLTSDGGSEDLELNEVLEKEGVNLPDMEKHWRTQGLENIPEEEIKKISDLFIARQQAALDKQKKSLGIMKGTGNQSKSLFLHSLGWKQNKRRGRGTNGEVLHDLGILMINSGKMKDLHAFLSYQ